MTVASEKERNGAFVVRVPRRVASGPRGAGAAVTPGSRQKSALRPLRPLILGIPAEGSELRTFRIQWRRSYRRAVRARGHLPERAGGVLLRWRIAPWR